MKGGIRSRTEPAEPNRTIPEPAGTGRGTEPIRTEPSHDASEKRRPKSVELGQTNIRTEPNRSDYLFKIKQNRTEPNRFFPV